MLEHADRGDLVELDALQVAEVPQFDGDAVLQSEPLHLRHSEIVLRLGEGHAMRPHTVMLRGMAHQPAPAAADVEHVLAGLQAQLAADHLELGALRGRDVGVPVGEVGAGIDHLGVEKELVEIIRQVVVELHQRLVVAPFAMLRGLRAGIGMAGAAAARAEQEGQQRARGQDLVDPPREPAR